MKNFIFKSSALAPDLQKILQLLLSEQRAQRVDLANLLRMVKSMTINKDLQTQVDKYFSDDEEESFHETSPQTDSEKQNGNSSS